MLRILLLYYLVIASQYMLRAEEFRDRQSELNQPKNQNEYVYVLEDKRRPEVEQVVLKDEEENDLLGDARILNRYNVDYMSSGVVGLVGPPVELTYDERLEELLLTFYYVEGELRGIPERNLIILHEDKDGFYVQVGEEIRDDKMNTISVHINEPGTYLLADCYQWYSAWGVDMSAYAYEVDPTQVISDWERECDTGSILELADRQWAVEHAPVFTVSTPEELASVVYYVNAVSDSYEDIYIYLESDIDLEGYEWVPMGWLGAGNSSFNGVIDGRGHSISNMTISTAYSSHCAFVGHSSNLVVKDISFHNALISGGSYTGIIGGEIYDTVKWENIHVDGVIKNASGEIGSICGREATLYFENCDAEVYFEERDGTRKPIEYFSHRLEVLENTPPLEDFQLTLQDDGGIKRTEAETDYRNLCWHVEVDHVQVLSRLAENERVFYPMNVIPQFIPEGSDCQIWLEAFTGETYTRVSNIIYYPTE